MSDEELPVLESAESPYAWKTGWMWLALAIPVVAGVALCFAPTVAVAYSISIPAVVLSAACVAIDAYRLGNVDLKGMTRESPWVLFLGMCAFWVVIYPIAYFRRRQFGGPQLGFYSLGTAAFFMGAPLLAPFVLPRSLPGCAAAESVKLLDQIVRTTSLGPILTAIDGHREVRFDAATGQRECACVVHSTVGEIPGKYIIEWQDRKAGLFQIRIPTPILPGCNSPEVLRVLEQLIRSTPEGAAARSLDSHRELSYDPQTDVRRGVCLLHTDTGHYEVKFVVEWQNQNEAQFQVRILSEQE